MLHSVDDPPPRILPLRVLLVMLLACLGGSWFMVPREDELIERLFKDRQYERVVAVLRDDVHGMSDHDVNGLRRLDESQLMTLSRLLNLTPREQLRTIFASRNSLTYDEFVHSVVTAAVRYVDVLPPQEAFELIRPTVQRVPESLRLELLNIIAHNAHAVANPGLAAEVLTLASECQSADWKLARAMTQSYQWSGRLADAAKNLRVWLSGNYQRLAPTEREEAKDMTFALALESGNPSEAFDVCLQELQDLPGTAHLPIVLMERSMNLALQSSRTKDLVPWMVRLVQEMPAAKMTLADLRRDSSQDVARFADYRRWAGVLAQWSDWNSAFDTAFDHHLRLAVLGETKSRDRCVQLQNYLGRAEECCEMLVTLGETKDRPELALVTATLLAELGRDDEAKPRFEAWIQRHPKDREAHFDYACLLEDMGDEIAARKAFAAMLQAFPDDVPAMKRLAAACIRDADYPAALGIYTQMADRAHDPDTLENYAMIAESLDDHEAEFRALHLTTRLTDQPTTELYLDLAETASYLPEAQVSIDALNEGLQRLPHSTQLRIALANHYLHAERPDEALAALASDNLRNNFEAAQFILGMSDAITDAPRALEMLGADVETRFQLGAENRLQLAVLHYKAGHQDQCDRLFASVKEERRLRKPLAEARYQIGDFGESARLMTAYLKETQRPSPIEWVFLGDVYEQLGNLDEARKAYDLSLALLTADLGDTASTN